MAGVAGVIAMTVTMATKSVQMRWAAWSGVARLAGAVGMRITIGDSRDPGDVEGKDPPK